MENKNLTSQLGQLFTQIVQFDELNLALPTKEILTPSELHIVECIGNKEYITSKEIGEKLNIMKGAVSQQIKKLIEGDVIVKVTNSSDKRTSYLKLTEKGMVFYQEHQEIKNSFKYLLESQLNDVEMEGFFKGINLLNDSLNERIVKGEKYER